MNKLPKIFLLLIVLLVLSIPLLQQGFNFSSRNDSLSGSFDVREDTALTAANWFSKMYQDRKDTYLNENFGFRNFLVRLHNQINFSFYGDINVKDVFKGKENYLYNYSFFNSYSGRNYNEHRADSIFKDLMNLNESLISINKKLLICFAPCKESFFPEFLPDTCLLEIKKENYYDAYRKRLLKSNIPFLDYNKYFQNLKNSSPYPLFTQGAVHWTIYGANIALDTLLKRISFETNKKINNVRFKSVDVTDTARGADDDISKAMNLLANVNSERLAYPELEFISNNDSCHKPKVIIAGDSFFYGLNNTWIPISVFSTDSYFLYYYSTAVSFIVGKKDVKVKELDLPAELKNTEIVILFFNIGNLNGFPFGATLITKNVP